MTAIVAIKADDGIVMVSDGAATYSAPSGAPTIKQPASKLIKINDALILGCSSSVGLVQCFEEELTKATSSCVSRQPRYAFETRNDFREAIIKKFWPHAHAAMERAKVLLPLYGQQVALTDCTQHSLACFLTKDGSLQLAQISISGQIEFASDDLPFVSVGSGQPAADPFLAFLRKILWEDKEVSCLRDALFAALWTVKHVVDVQPGGVGRPFQIMTMQLVDGSGDKKKLEIKEHEESKIDEDLELIDKLQKEIRKISVGLFNPDTASKADQIPEQATEQIAVAPNPSVSVS